MKHFAAWLIVIIGSLIVLVWALGEAQEKQASRLYARAHVIEAKAGARQDLLAALMPYTIIGLATLGGTIAVVALMAGTVAIVALAKRTPAQSHRVIERQTILLLQPGQHSRREIYKLLSAGREEL